METLTNSTPSVAYLSSGDTLTRANNSRESIMAASVMAAGSVMKEPRIGTTMSTTM